MFSNFLIFLRAHNIHLNFLKSLICYILSA
jgi:hypothetical protein